MYVNVKIVGLLAVLAISISAHPILEGFGDVDVPFISYQNRTTSSFQEIVHDNKDVNISAVEQTSNSIANINSINDPLNYNAQNDGDIPNAIHELEKPEGEIIESGKTPGEILELGKPPGEIPELGKPVVEESEFGSESEKPDGEKSDADNPTSEKPVTNKPASEKPNTNKHGKPMGQDGQETTTATPIETTTAAPENSTANNSTPDPIRASTAVFFTLLLVLVKCI